MSLKNKKSLIFSFCFLILCGALFAYQSKPASQKRWQPHISEFIHRNQQNRVIQLKITHSSLSQNDEKKEIQLQGKITMPFDYSGSLRYKWTFGQNVVLKTGSKEGTLSHFRANEEQYITLYVTGLVTSANRHVGLEVWGEQNEKPIYSDILISTQMEKSFEFTVKQVEKLRAQQVKKNE